MRVTLIHNPGAGTEEQPDAKELKKLLKDAGHELDYRSSKEDGWKSALKEATDLVAVAGGDGTVSRVARRMAGRGVPIAILPLGTANNIANSLGIADLPIRKLIGGWDDAPHVAFDTAMAKGAWGKRRFVEGLGIGLFAWTMPQASDSKQLSKIDDPGEAVAHVMKMLQDRLQNYKPRAIEARLDGEDLSGEYIMFEALNLQYVGPNLHLAPGVEPGDGKLHVVAVRESERGRFDKYLEHWQEGKAPAVKLPTWSGEALKIKRGDYEVHVDDKLWPDPEASAPGKGIDIEVEVEPAALAFLVPEARKP
jgi:diacylglycerol kinase family enzyme